MARLSIVVKNEKRKKLAKKYEEKRKELKKKGDQRALDKLPRNSSPVRVRNRCALTGRGRGFVRDFKLSRNKFREKAQYGLIPGIKKASW